MRKTSGLLIKKALLDNKYNMYYYENQNIKQYTKYSIQAVLFLIECHPMTSRSFSLVLVNEILRTSFPQKQEPIKTISLESIPYFYLVNGSRKYKERAPQDRINASSRQKKVAFILK